MADQPTPGSAAVGGQTRGRRRAARPPVAAGEVVEARRYLKEKTREFEKKSERGVSGKERAFLTSGVQGFFFTISAAFLKARMIVYLPEKATSDVILT